ncbi:MULTISPECIES: hypothetical protein [unclassified Endozoicomonas]|uniref:hypothetical protein n=1 Tax=unclassified Endozoicomonas TaxID=2644528 RepID=UPI003BB54B12
MQAVKHHEDRLLAAMDAKEAFEEGVESYLETIENGFIKSLESQGQFNVSREGTFTAYSFLQFLTLEEFHPMQGFRWLAVKQLVADCNDENSRLSGWEIINYAIKRGYCNG